MYSYTMASQIGGNISLQYLNKPHPFMNKSEVILDSDHSNKTKNLS